MRAGAKTRKLRIVQLAAVIFLTVSGGPYGLEPLLRDTGAAAAFFLLITAPLLWDIPTILTILELNSMMPRTGGYYQWVKRALGIRWAFYEGWWTWLYTFADLAIYPVLFVQYLAFFFPQAEAFKIPICLAIIWTSAFINILGIVTVGRTSIVLSAIVLFPFIGLFAWVLIEHHGQLHIPSPSLKNTAFSNIGLGLYTIMWNFLGWDNVTTYAEEVSKPVRSYLYSILVAFITVFIIYFTALAIATTTRINANVLMDQGFPSLGELVGGRWLGAAIAIGGMASALGLYSAVLLSVSRIPEVMAEDRLLPLKLSALHPKYNSPYVSILCCSVVVSGMILWTFGELVIIDITLYGAALLLEYIALIKLRKIAASDHRPFKIPLNRAGLILMAILPFLVYALALTGVFVNDREIKPVIFALVALLSAEVVWLIIKWRNKSRVYETEVKM
jgi:amino acid transporter